MAWDRSAEDSSLLGKDARRNACSWWMMERGGRQQGGRHIAGEPFVFQPREQALRRKWHMQHDSKALMDTDA